MWLLWGTGALAQTADFDTQLEGYYATVITDGGLTFQNLDFRDGSPPPGVMTIEQADGTLAGLPGFTPANALGFGGFATGPDGSFSRFGQFEIQNGSTADSAEVSVFEFNCRAGSWLELDATLGGVLVASQRVNLVGGPVITPHTLTVSGYPFDLLTLRAGPRANEAAFLLLDHVVLTTTPLPHTGETGGTGETGHTALVGHTGEPVVLHTGEPPGDTAVPDPTEPTKPGPADPAPGCGCDSGGSGLGGWAFAGLLAVRLRQRRAPRQTTRT